MKQKFGFLFGYHTQFFWVLGYETHTRTQNPNPHFFGCECMPDTNSFDFKSVLYLNSF